MRNLLRAIFKTGSGSIINIILGVISSKVIAVVLGSSGVGLYSLINQTLTTATTAGTMGGQTALVQGLASKQGAEKDKYLTTVFWIFVCGATIISIGFLLFSPLIAKTVFASNDGKTITLVRWMTIPSVLTIIYSYLICLLNGFRAIGRLAIGQIILSVVTVSLVYPVSKLVSSGYIIAFIVMTSASTLGGIIFCLTVAHKEKWLNPLIVNFIPKFDKGAVKHFYRIARTTFITSLIATGTLLSIRTIIIQYGGFSSAGIFSVAWGLSMMYVMLLLGSFGSYYLPTLSGINDIPARNTLIQNLFRVSLLLIIPLIITVIVLKSLVITILYTYEFMPSLKIIRWMLIGDYFKVGGWVLAMPMLAYGDMKVFFWTESLWYIGFLILSYIGIFYYNDMQLIGIAFLILYAFLFVYTIFYAHNKHSVVLTSNSVVHWVLGLLLIIVASWQTWGDTQVNWISAPIWIAVAIGFSWMTLNRDEKSKLIKMIYKRKD
ncbi:oligosaccharide flippase family protein [Methanosarcina mazei]|uniref:Oligosaccharide flippase family protein n=2 Tax=Methanosarcina mazei TaxID=2209 RepID=A0A6C0VMX7_METMZ|nr:oligosaccharide flippase family protein [Methanosarcina mazei]